MPVWLETIRDWLQNEVFCFHRIKKNPGREAISGKITTKYEDASNLFNERNNRRNLKNTGIKNYFLNFKSLIYVFLFLNGVIEDFKLKRDLP